jgi:hypothetical protein
MMGIAHGREGINQDKDETWFGKEVISLITQIGQWPLIALVSHGMARELGIRTDQGGCCASKLFQRGRPLKLTGRGSLKVACTCVQYLLPRRHANQRCTKPDSQRPKQRQRQSRKSTEK